MAPPRTTGQEGSHPAMQCSKSVSSRLHAAHAALRLPGAELGRRAKALQVQLQRCKGVFVATPAHVRSKLRAAALVAARPAGVSSTHTPRRVLPGPRTQPGGAQWCWKRVAESRRAPRQQASTPQQRRPTTWLEKVLACGGGSDAKGTAVRIARAGHPEGSSPASACSAPPGDTVSAVHVVGSKRGVDAVS